MRPSRPLHSRGPRALAAALLLAALLPAAAHDTRAGDLVIDHPYAIPSLPGARNGAMYLRALKNTGSAADRLLGGRTEAAATLQIHRSTMDGDVMRMRQLDALDLPPGTDLKLRHGGELHLMLVDLKAPLKQGDRIAVTLRFERAGEQEVLVWVQQPREAAQPHKH